MPRSKAGRAAVCGTVFVLVLGVGVFALREASDHGSGDGTSAVASAVSTAEESVGHSPMHRPASVASPDSSIADVMGTGTVPVARDSEDGRRMRSAGGGVSDTGPFIDADNDSGDYPSGPVSDIGNFIDPDAG